MKQRILWFGVATLSFLTLISLSWMGIGPNLGLTVGYYGQFNRVLDSIEANPELEVIQTILHQDMALEDFYITVRTQDNREVRLQFEGAHKRSFEDLLQELKKVGM